MMGNGLSFLVSVCDGLVCGEGYDYVVSGVATALVIGRPNAPVVRRWCAARHATPALAVAVTPSPMRMQAA